MLPDVSRILKHLTSQNNLDKEKDLSTCLKEERLYGPSTSHVDCNTLSPAEFYAFKEVFLIVEDATGIHRPLLKKEFKRPKSEQEAPTWPILQECKLGRCPFIPDPITSRIGKRVTPEKRKIEKLVALESKENFYSKESGLSQPSTTLPKPAARVAPQGTWLRLDKRTISSVKVPLPRNQRTTAPKTVEPLKPQQKPGYCENCMINYDNIFEVTHSLCSQF
jgi:hypothetical protein